MSSKTASKKQKSVQPAWLSSGCALIHLALRELGCSQKALADKLQVSSTQISKWKTDDNEHMSFEMEQKIERLLDASLLDVHPSVLWAVGSREHALKWSEFIAYLAKCSGVIYDEVDESVEFIHLPAEIFEIFHRLGMPIPTVSPEILNVPDEHSSENVWVEYENRWHEDSTALFIKNLLTSFVSLNEFYIECLVPLLGKNEEMDQVLEDIRCGLMHLAVTKNGISKEDAPNIVPFSVEVNTSYREMLTSVKRIAFEKHIPLPVEVMDLLYKGPEDLDNVSEAQVIDAMYGGSGRTHPDIYMNELLEKIREIHSVLPLIIEKLGIDLEVALAKRGG